MTVREAARNMLRFAGADWRLYRFWRSVLRALCLRGDGCRCGKTTRMEHMKQDYYIHAPAPYRVLLNRAESAELIGALCQSDDDHAVWADIRDIIVDAMLDMTIADAEARRMRQ